MRVPLLFAFCLTVLVSSICPAFARSLPSEGEKVIFKTAKIRVGDKVVKVEVADTDKLRERGLMFRKSLPTDEGMLFVFEKEKQLGFWMMNTYIHLSIAFFDKKKKLVNIEDMVPAVLGETRPPTYLSRGPAMYALEMNKGWFQKNKIPSDATFEFVNRPK